MRFVKLQQHQEMFSLKDVKDQIIQATDIQNCFGLDLKPSK